MKNLILSILFFTSTLVAFSAQASQCHAIFSDAKHVHEQQNQFHNKTVEGILSSGVSLKAVTEITRLMVINKGDSMIVDKDGFVAAADVGNHDGGYGSHIWLRDFSRVYKAGLVTRTKVLNYLFSHGGTFSGEKRKLSNEILLSRIESKKAAHAMLRLLEDPQWTKSALENIKDPLIHRPEHGQSLVIWIRRLLLPFQQKRLPTAEELGAEGNWGHKQNDALASFAESVLDAVKSRELTIDDFSESAKRNLILLASYLVRLEYWKMWDSGSWEELAQRRTSSIAMVTQFLDRFNSHFNSAEKMLDPKTPEDFFFKHLKEQTLSQLLNDESIPQDTLTLISKSLEAELATAITEGQKYSQEQLSADRPIETTNEKGETSRFEDAALLHILWSSSKILSQPLLLKLVDGLKVLEKPSGYIRYANDWFLYGGVQALRFRKILNLENQIAIPDGEGGFRPATESDAESIIQLHKDQTYTKDMTAVLAAAGEGLDAQWTLGDAYLTQFFSKLYVQTHDTNYLDHARYHYTRLAGLITGENLKTSEGNAVHTWRLPEAYLPVRVFVNGEIQIRYFVSPNSPLNWATSEFNLASFELLQALRLYESASSSGLLPQAL